MANGPNIFQMLLVLEALTPLYGACRPMPWDQHHHDDEFFDDDLACPVDVDVSTSDLHVCPCCAR